MTANEKQVETNKDRDKRQAHEHLIYSMKNRLNTKLLPIGLYDITNILTIDLLTSTEREIKEFMALNPEHKTAARIPEIASSLTSRIILFAVTPQRLAIVTKETAITLQNPNDITKSTIIDITKFKKILIIK